MKINKIILVSILLLILTLGAVSASDNTDISNNVTSSQDVDIIADDDDEWDDDFAEYEDGSGIVDPNIKVNWPSELKVGDEPEITFDLPEDLQTNVVLFLNNERIDDGQEADNSTPYELFIDEFGKTDLKFKFYGDDKYKPVTLHKTYDVKDYKFNLEFSEDTVIYGQETNLTIEFPFDATGSITVGGVKYVIGDDDIDLTVPLKNLKIGTNQIQVKYSGDDKYPSKTKTISLNVKAQVMYEPVMAFNNVTFYLELPSNAAGSLEVCVDGNNTKTSGFTNGLAEVKFSGLKLGVHTFKAKYTGSDYACNDVEQQFEVAPDIDIVSFGSTSDVSYVKLTLPEGESGILDLHISRYDGLGEILLEEIVRHENVSGEALINISTIVYGYYVYEARYTSTSGYSSFIDGEGLVREEFSMDMSVPQDVLADEEYVEVNVTFIGINTGTIELYVDGEYYDEMDCDATGLIQFYIDDALGDGSHIVKAVFTGNERYSPMEKSATITSKSIVITVPDEILLGLDDEISIETVNDATGDLVVYVDGKEFARQKIEDGYASISLSSLKFQTYSVTAAYEKGNYPGASQSKDVNVSYTFQMDDEPSEFASEDLFEINVPSDIPVEDIVVKINNVTYDVVKTDKGIGINTTGLDIGSHVISVEYAGDDTFYPLSIEKTLDVAGKISVPSEVTAGDEKVMSLTLPKNPQGVLQLFVYDENYRTYVPQTVSRFVESGNNAIAEIPVSFLGLGDHKIKLVYTGDDYEVEDIFREISMKVDMKFARELEYSKKQVIILNLTNAQGNIEVYLDDEEYDVVDFVNGIARIEFKGLEVGQHTFELMYEGVYAFDVEEMFVVYPSISVPTVTVIDGATPITLKSGWDPVGTVTVYADGKKYSELDLYGGKETISLGGLSNGVHKLSIVYDSWDDLQCVKNYTVSTKKASITGKDMSMNYLDGSKFKVQVKDYKGKKVNKGQVKFYVDGKLFKTVKTDKNGYASVVLTHAPGKHTVKAVYKASTLVKTVTVKQILTLKKVTVKKSAKKLDLTATVKKVKGLNVKNQKVTFKFNGKTYKAVTNAKGVAKVTIPQNILKKLKVGKKITYQATFIKATVKQTVKVSK